MPHEHVRDDFGKAVIKSLQDFIALCEVKFSLLQVDEAIDNLILDAGEIVRAFLHGGRRDPACFRVAEAACAPVHPVKVKVGIVQAFAERALAHLFDSRHDADLLQVFLEKREVTQVFLARDEVDGKRLAVLFKNAFAIHLVTRFSKERTSLFGIVAVDRRRRVLVIRPEVRIIAVQEEVLSVHVLFIHCFAIQKVRKCAADADILELRLAEVDGHALETNRFLVVDALLDGPAFFHSIKVGLFHPDAARVNRVSVEVLFLECFERLGLVVHEAVADLLEVVLAMVPVLLEAPPVATALEFDKAVFTERLDDVRARDHREFVTDLVEVLASPHMLRECEHACSFPEVAPVRFLRGHADGQAIDDFRAFKAAEAHLENRREVFLIHDDIVIELHIFGGDGLAIAPFGARVHMERERSAVFGDIPLVGEDADFTIFGSMQAHERFEHHVHEFGREAVIVFPHVERLRHGGTPKRDGTAGAGILGGNRVELAGRGRINRENRAIGFRNDGAFFRRLAGFGFAGFIAGDKSKSESSRHRDSKQRAEGESFHAG